MGEYGSGKSRDYEQHYYADDISAPRDGPNPRAVSNAFFKRKKTIYYEHTPLLLGLVDSSCMTYHGLKTPQPNTSTCQCPKTKTRIFLNTTFRVWRTEAAPGTGTSRENPREVVNRATTWLDVSSLYGSTHEVARKLRTFSSGKLLTQELLASGSKGESFPTCLLTVWASLLAQSPNVEPTSLFAGGDPRTNEDWIMLAVHTLLLREHNRLCDMLASQHPEYDDEALYQTTRILLSAKFALIANAYQMVYFRNMTWPSDDGFPLFREMLGENWLEINPANAYPWPTVNKGGKPTVVSAEMAVVYRFHEFIISTFPIKDQLNQTMWDQSVFETGFNATGFITTGLDNILRGITSTTIPNFKSGVDESFRSGGSIPRTSIRYCSVEYCTRTRARPSDVQ